jgi:hypothetical protein
MMTRVLAAVFLLVIVLALALLAARAARYWRMYRESELIGAWLPAPLSEITHHFDNLAVRRLSECNESNMRSSDEWCRYNTFEFVGTIDCERKVFSVMIDGHFFLERRLPSSHISDNVMITGHPKGNPDILLHRLREYPIDGNWFLVEYTGKLL